jgi:uncharacterized damage-inducible protein DinB
MLEELVKYTQKADEIMLNAYAENGFSIPEANALFGHLLGAQHIWAHRVIGLPAKYTVWEPFLPQYFKAISQDNFLLLFKILREEDLSRSVAYSNSAGVVFNNTINEILLHVCNHGTYHRGQLATLLRKAGYKPPVTDYIMLKRDNLL